MCEETPPLDPEITPEADMDVTPESSEEIPRPAFMGTAAPVVSKTPSSGFPGWGLLLGTLTVGIALGVMGTLLFTSDDDAETAQAQSQAAAPTVRRRFHGLQHHRAPGGF